MALAQMKLEKMLIDGTREYRMEFMDEYELEPLVFRATIFKGEIILVERVEQEENDDPELQIARRG